MRRKWEGEKGAKRRERDEAREGKTKGREGEKSGKKRERKKGE